MEEEKVILDLLLKEYDDEFIESISSESLDCVDIFEDLNYTSIQFIQLVVDLESLFMIEFDDDMLLMDNFSTIGQIKSLVMHLIDNRNGDIHE